MGSNGIPPGVLFANLYMGVVEERVFSELPVHPTYCQYIDDNFVQVDAEEDLQTLRDTSVATPP